MSFDDFWRGSEKYGDICRFWGKFGELCWTRACKFDISGKFGRIFGDLVIFLETFGEILRFLGKFGETCWTRACKLDNFWKNM